MHSELSRVLDKLRPKIADLQSKGLNEQDTKAAFINPVLCALGWHVGNLDEVKEQYRRTPKSDPVDYALLVSGTPRFLVEAKALGHELREHKSVRQVLFYACEAGVKWVVLTNGDDYHLYNSCVEAPLDQRLFCPVRISGSSSRAGEVLALLSRERRIDSLEEVWQNHFADGQVRDALRKMFLPGPDPLVLRFLRKRVKGLTAKEIKASLGRVCPRFRLDDQGTGQTGQPRAPRKRAVRGTTPLLPKHTHRASWGRHRVSLKEVMDGGFLKAGKLTAKFRGRSLEAKLLASGVVVFQGEEYQAPGPAAEAAARSVSGKKAFIDGWMFWKYQDKNGDWVRLKKARQEYMPTKAN
jgi:hypothetical protein